LEITGTGTAIARTGTGILIGQVGDIIETGAGIGNGTGIDIDGGEMDLIINRLDADVAYDLATGTILRLVSDYINGTETLAGTAVAHITIAGFIGRSASDFETNFPQKIDPVHDDIVILQDGTSNAKNFATISSIGDMAHLITRHDSQQFGGLIPTSDDTKLAELGLYDSATYTYNSANMTGDGVNPYLQMNSAFGANQSIYIETVTSPNWIHRTEWESIARIRVAMNAITNIRIFFGFTDQTGATPINANDPAGNRAGISVISGDTNFHCSSKDGVTEERSDIGAAVVTTFMEFEIALTTGPSTATFRAFSAKGDQLGSTIAHTTRVPSLATGLQLYIGLQTLVATIGQLKVAGATGANRFIS
jgi:hypothetical protein